MGASEAEVRLVLRAIPACPEHGECITHALEWIRKRVEEERVMRRIEGIVRGERWGIGNMVRREVERVEVEPLSVEELEALMDEGE